MERTTLAEALVKVNGAGKHLAVDKETKLWHIKELQKHKDLDKELFLLMKSRGTQT